MSSSIDSTFSKALASFQAGKLNDAEKLFKKVLRQQAKHVAALNLLSILLARLEKYDEAETYVQSALKLSSSSDTTFYNYGIILKALNRPAEALEQLSRALSINENVAETWNTRGTVLNDLKRYDDAIADFKRAVAIQPNYAEAYNNQARSLAELKRHDEAVATYDRALSLKPNLAESWLGRGNALSELKRYDEALAAFDKTLSLAPNVAEAWLNCGNVFAELNRFDEASAAYDKALSLKPHFAEAWRAKGQASIGAKQFQRAIAEFDKALAIAPDLKYLEGHRLGAQQTICDWTDLETRTSRILQAIKAGKPVSGPFSLLGIESSAADQLRCAQMFVADRYPEVPPLWRGGCYNHDRIRVAYLSSDFRNHAISYLISEILELHDRTRFEIVGISFGPDDQSDMHSRIKESFDQFYDVQAQADSKAAELIKNLEIDIAIDLNNYTEMSRPGILAYRPAPIQASYLGYPATMGAAFIDYAIVDKFVLPQEQQAFWPEKFVFMPDSYLAHDTVSKRRMPLRPPTRKEAGLPDEAFVFCCFNSAFKITPSVFEVWMRLLKATEGSVAWFSSAAEPARSNLRMEAKRAGVDPERLIFAPKTDRMEDHLSRHRVADLFLDTPLYNAHTTAADALWAGLPVITCVGENFPARVAGSLLHAIGLPELATNSLRDYETLALRLAHDPAHLENIKSKLIHNRDTHPLFDTARFTRHLEAAYMTMVQRHERGESPASFAVEAIS